ncbi:DUF5916 domain-containing protein [Archangium violaceum]|uniref:carbohydrate binding family 9 domain-containing protein n=1 Tax=Archangium violaceum TaxID=83451 RepID=UPI002B2AE905|nr:DUF5916 domain-containing protein [Archangium gephyra]
MRGLALLLTVVAWAAPVQAREAEGPEVEGFEALRTSEPPRVDGRLDEEAWRQAPVFDRFHQSFPEPGAAPSERTEVRVLYDDGNLYVGVRCFDGQPAAIRAPLGRRDELPMSDVVRVMVDSLRDRRSGLVFAVNAGGTLADARITQDTRTDTAWDGIWEGASSVDGLGWSAELRIPLRLLRFPEAGEQRWGFHVRRELARTHEILESVPLPRDVNALVSRFAELRALKELRPPRQMLVLPYVALRSVREGVGPVGPSADVGVDVQAGLTSNLSLTLTVNPDFGQVEADQLLYNPTRVELYFPEKRPFFLDGLELFEPLVDDSLPEQSLLYSRRMGLELPLLGAVKLSGSVTENVQVAVLDAVVAGEAGRGDEEPLDTSVRFLPWRPLHLAPGHTLPGRVGPPTNFLAGVVRARVSEAATVGGSVALATPLRPDCEPEDAELEGCTARGGQAATLDMALRSDSGDYVLAAQLSGSRVTGGPAGGRLLADGTLLRPGDMGYGLRVSGGKEGGEPWRLRLGYGLTSPRLNLNPTGFQPMHNEQLLLVNPELVRIDWHGLPEVAVGVHAQQRWSADGRHLALGTRAQVEARVVLPDSSAGDCYVGLETARQDLFEVVGAGVALQRPSFVFGSCAYTTDLSRPLSLEAVVYADRLMGVPVRHWSTGQNVSLGGTWRPLPQLSTSLSLSFENASDGPRWLDSSPEGLHRFGELVPRFVGVTLRQLVVLSPTLTLQAHAQLYSGYGRYDRFFEVVGEPGARLRLADLREVPLTGEDPAFHTAALNINLVLRWEYALGSTLFVVYARSQESLARPGVPVSFTLLPEGLLEGSHSDALMVKLSYAL